jgi:hypothetical protein
VRPGPPQQSAGSSVIDPGLAFLAEPTIVSWKRIWWVV